MYHSVPGVQLEGVPVEGKVLFDGRLIGAPEFHFHWNPGLENGRFHNGEKCNERFISLVTNVNQHDVQDNILKLPGISQLKIKNRTFMNIVHRNI
jgi:hypothetical protein